MAEKGAIDWNITETWNPVGREPDGTPSALRRKLEQEAEGRNPNLPLPWPVLNLGVGNGLAPGNITVVAGPPGGAKSYFLLNLLLHLTTLGHPWRLLPLEDEAQAWAMRFLAVRERSWGLVSRPCTPVEAEHLGRTKLDALDRHADLVSDLYRRVAENPRLPVTVGGRRVVYDVGWRDVAEFLRTEGGRCRLAAVDPLSQITFDEGGPEYRGQQLFMREIAAAAAETGVHALLVAHTVKTTEKTNRDPLEGIQGAAMITRLAHNVLTLVRHDERDSQVAGGTTARHAVTVTIAKSRNGYSGQRLAFGLDKAGPVFREYGLIV
ncbi:MAG: AAA family ATPase [Planctomycetaceae bacterium]|nr:AAA family ATPase [Planctomycetaceae bacterium]